MRILITDKLKKWILEEHWPSEMIRLVGNVYEVYNETNDRYYIKDDKNWSIPKDCAEIIKEKPRRIRWYRNGKLEEKFMLKKFEAFNNNIDIPGRIYIIGVPSGEALQVTRQELDDLVENKLVYYSTKYVETGFFVFDDSDIDQVKEYITPIMVAKKKAPHDVMIYNHDFDEILMDAILGIVDEYPNEIEIYVQDDCMGITAGDTYIEVYLSETGSKYTLTKRLKGNIVDKYKVATDNMLINRIDHELFH